MRTIKYLFCLILTAIITLTGCNPEFDVPPLEIPHATQEANTTILELKNTFTNDIDTIRQKEDGSDYIISGRVIGNDISGNIYKSLIIQDETAALTLSINATNMYTTYRVGQQVVINCTGMYIGMYRGLQQLGYPDQYNDTWQTTFMPILTFTEHTELNGIPAVDKVDTLAIDLGTLSSQPIRVVQSQLIVLKDVYFEEGGKNTFADADASASRTLYDTNGNSIVVRNSNYSNFAKDMLPKGYGNVVGILSYYGSSYQLLLRTKSDCYDFSEEERPGTQENPYGVADAIELQGKDVSAWVKGFIVGAVAPGVTTIASNDDIQFTAPAALANTLVIAPSADTKDYTKCLVISLKEGSVLRNVANLKDNPTVLGKEISLKGTFAPYLGASGITENNGTTGEFVLEGVDLSGNGSKERPYSVAEAKQVAKGTKEVYVKGYIVGCVDGMTLEQTAVQFAGFTVQSNIVLADDASSTQVGDLIPVQLASGSDARNQLNLSSNPTNKGKLVVMKCDIESYFGTTGIKNISEFELSGEGSGGDGGDNGGDNSLENPFTIAEAQATAVGTTGVYVKGYMVGCVDGMYFEQAALQLSDFTVQSNILLADDANATLIENMMPVQLASGTDARNQMNLVSNPANKGKSVIVKCDILAYFGKTGIKNITEVIIDGSDNGGGDNGGNTGDNSKENPFSVLSVQSMTETADVWVKGHIVGCIDGMSFNQDGAYFTEPFPSQTNLIIADTNTETDVTKTIPVQLPSGDIRTQLNLNLNPANHGKTLLMKCTVTKYFGVMGIKSISEYELK